MGRQSDVNGKDVLDLVSCFCQREWYGNIFVSYDHCAAQHGGILPINAVDSPKESPLILNIWRVQLFGNDYIHYLSGGDS